MMWRGVSEQVTTKDTTDTKVFVGLTLVSIVSIVVDAVGRHRKLSLPAALQCCTMLV